MKRRSRDLIMSQILGVCEEGARKTKIVQQANLNSQRIDRYLEILIGRGFITKMTIGSRAFYKTTDKGIQLKEKFERLQSEMESLNKILSDAAV